MATHPKPWSLNRWYAVALIEAFVISKFTGADHALTLLLVIPLACLFVALPLVTAGLSGMLVGGSRAYHSMRRDPLRACDRGARPKRNGARIPAPPGSP